MAQRKTFSLNEWCPSCDRCNAALLDGCVEKRKKKSLVSRLTDRGAEICASAQSPIFFSHAAAPCFFVPSPRRKCLPHFISWGSNRGGGGGGEMSGTEIASEGGIGTLHMRETQRKRRKETPTTDATSILLLLLASSSSVRPGGGEDGGGQLRRRQQSRPGIVSAVSPNSIFWPMLVDTRLTSPEVFFG